MTNRAVTIDLPEQLVDLLGSPEAAAAKVKEALIIELLREVRISQGQAAHLLAMNRWDFLDFLAKHQIPSGPLTIEEVEEEFKAIERLAGEDREHAGDQQQ